MMTLANRITLLRIALIPVFVILYLQEQKQPILHWVDFLQIEKHFLQLTL